MPSSYKTVIRHQMSVLKQDRILKAKCKYSGESYEMLKQAEEQEKLEKKFWSEITYSDDPCQFF